MIKKGIDLVRLSPHRWLHRFPWQDPAMACDACSWEGRKRCAVCKFRSATVEEFLNERRRSVHDTDQL